MTDLATATSDTPVVDTPIVDENTDNQLDTLLDTAFEDEITEGATTATPNTENSPGDPQLGDTTGDASGIPNTESAQNVEGSDPVDPTLAPPARWDAEGLKLYEQASPELKAVISKRENTLQAEHTQRQQENAGLRQEVLKLQTQPDQELTQILGQARQRYSSKFANVTEEALLNAITSGEISPDEAQAIRVEKFQEEQALSQLENVAETRRVNQRKIEMQNEELELQKLAPELVDPETGPQKRAEIASYLQNVGYQQDDLVNITARDMITAQKALMWDNLQKAKSGAKPAATRTGKAVTATSAQSGNSKGQRMAALRAKGTPEALDALLDMELDAEFAA